MEEREGSQTEDDLPPKQENKVEEVQLSKSQRKKLEKREKIKNQRKLRRKEKKLKRKRDEETAGPLKRIRYNAPVSKDAISVFIDCSYEDIMTDKERKGVVAQLVLCYAKNRRSNGLIKLRITDVKENGELHKLLRENQVDSWSKIAKKYLEGDKDNEDQCNQNIDQNNIIDNENDTESSKVEPHTSLCTWDYFEEAKNEFLKRRADDVPPEEYVKGSNIIYLSSDSPNTLQTIDKSKCYVIGGLLDHNRFKRLSQTNAEKLGIATAALPISEYIQLSGRKVLTINQVFEILLEYTKSNDWEQAFYAVIPKRKLAQDDGDDGDDDDDGEEAEKKNGDLSDAKQEVKTAET